MNLLLVRRAGGFSLVELMVSVVIGLLALLFATRLVITGESSKEAAIGGSDSMQNGMLALFSLSGDANAAGWGLNDPLLAGCDTVFDDAEGYELLSVKRGGVDIHPLAGVVIESNGAEPDRISFNSGSSQTAIGSVKMTADYANGNLLTVESNLPYDFNNRDVLVVASEFAPRCTLAQLSGFNPAQQNQMLINTGAGYRFNPTAGLGQAFTGNASYVYNLGQPEKLHFHTWSVNNGVLMLRATDLPGAAANPVSVADNVVSIKAQYGFDARAITFYDPNPPGNASLLTVYDKGVAVVAPVTGMQVTRWSTDLIDADAIEGAGAMKDYQRIAAVRIAIVARSKIAEKPDTSGQCTATKVRPVVFADATPKDVEPVPMEVNVAVAGDPVDWKCYRYRVFETIVPLVNSQFRP
jgi:type IV pilus assembly protein PilW